MQQLSFISLSLHDHININIMTFQKGQQMWQFRENDRTIPRLMHPNELLESFGKYYEWNEANPWYRHTLVQKTGFVEKIPVGRPLSLGGFCLHAGISPSTFYQYAKETEYLAIVDIIKTAIYTNKYEGAAVGVFSAAVMVRDLGLAENVSHTVEDNRKSVSELFPVEDQICEVIIEETSQAEIAHINTEVVAIESLEYNTKDIFNGTANKQELRILSTAREESSEEGRDTGRFL